MSKKYGVVEEKETVKRERKSPREKKDGAAHEAWERHKKMGRPKQRFVPETNSWEKVAQ
jgi:hypothetical protein